MEICPASASSVAFFSARASRSSEFRTVSPPICSRPDRNRSVADSTVAISPCVALAIAASRRA
eukprot:2494729-Lingulodinium_polyedra.AAC.1